MPSSFHRMFRYASAEKVDAKENFTTEALAANIRYDAAPFLALLRKRALIPGDAVVREVGVFTQVHFPSAGFVDLVLELAIDESVETFWVEVKVDAGEHGQQLTNYLRYIETRPDTTLLTLGKHPLRSGIPHLSWREVRTAALESSLIHWQDFAAFLEEIGMADEFDGPLAETEIASLGSTYSLLRKTAHALEPVCQYANKIWPGSDWPESHEEIVKVLGQQFRRHGRMVVFSRVPRAPAWVLVGLVREGRAASRGMMQAWVEARPKDLATRATLGAAYVQHPLPESWTRPNGEWPVFRVRADVPNDGSPQEIQGWFNARLDELDASKMLAKLGELTKTAPVVGEDAGQDE